MRSGWMMMAAMAIGCASSSSNGGDGTDATDSADATDATDGADATDATDGSDGTDATDSTDATDATDGTDAADGSDGTDGIPGELGFTFRKPGSGSVECGPTPMAPEGYTLEEPDRDWLCTFDVEAPGGAISGHIYVQSSIEACYTVGFPVPGMRVDGAWISIDGVVSPLAEPLYDVGGNHRNDYMEFTWQSVRFKLYHSSFGFGFRACHPMDCVQILGSGVPIIEDGCTKDRTIPVTCVPILEDGTHAPLEDTFEPCAGDPNYP